MTESAHSEVYSCQVTSLLQLYKNSAPKQTFQSQLFKTKFFAQTALHIDISQRIETNCKGFCETNSYLMDRT